MERYHGTYTGSVETGRSLYGINLGRLLRNINILFAILYMAVYTTPYFRYLLDSRFRLIGMGLLGLWICSTVLVYRIRRISSFSVFIFFNIFVFGLMTFAGAGNVNSIIAGYVAFWSFLFIFEVYFQAGDYKAIGIITKVMIAVICITCITTIIASLIYPNISKLTYKDSATGENVANQLNVGGFDYIAGACVLAPIFMVLVFKQKKRLYLIPLILCVVATFMSGYTIDFLVLCIGIICFLYSNKSGKLNATKIFFVFLTIIFVIFLAKNSINIADFIGKNNEHLAGRFREINSFLNGDLNDGTDLAYRITLYKRSIGTFLNHLLVGVGPYYFEGNHGVGDHSQIFDDMARYGMIGVIAYAIALYCFKHWLSRIKHDSGKQLSLMIPYISFVVLSFVNPTLILPILGLVLFFILPGLYFAD